MAKFLLDSGDPEEYKTISQLAKEKGSELWGSTTNPSLIAKKLAAAGKKLTTQEAFQLQKDIVLQIIGIVPGAVSGEVYADQTTTAQNMAEQGRDIASWHPRVVVKLPTTLEGMKARTQLRKEGIGINNTLVFSQEQVFAISLHEKLMTEAYGPAKTGFPAFISPFVGRLDDRGENGLTFLKYAVDLTHTYFAKDLVWMLEASIRNLGHMKEGIDMGSELLTIPAKVYQEWFALSPEQQAAVKAETTGLQDIPQWTPSEELLAIQSVDELMQAIESGKLDITHPLTTAGIDKFVADWHAILA